jgi:hypothetical protein
MESATECAKMNAMEEDATRKNSNHMEDSSLRNRRKSQIIHSMWEGVAVTVPGSDSAIVISGAPRWYTWDKSVFVNFKPMDGKEEYCHGVTGDGAKIEGMGSVVYKATLSNRSKTKITWQEVYYVPTFKVNITSTVETFL